MLRLVPFRHQEGQVPRATANSRNGKYVLLAFGKRVFDMIDTDSLGKLDDLYAVQSSSTGSGDVSDCQKTNWVMRHELYDAPPLLVFNAQNEANSEIRNKRTGWRLSHPFARE